MASLDVGIAQLLEDAGIGDFSAPATATPPVIVVGEMQESPDAQIAVIVEAGEAPDRILGRKPKYQVITRDVGYEVARDRAAAVFAALDQHQGELDGLPVGRVQPDFEPVYLGRDSTGIEGGRAEFTQTFTVFTR